MKKWLLLIALFSICTFTLNGCITYKLVQAYQASAIVEDFFKAVNSGDIDAAVALYAKEFRQAVGDDILKESLEKHLKRLGAFDEHKMRSWTIKQDASQKRQLVLLCEVRYELGSTIEEFVVSLGGSEKITSHEIRKEWRSGGAFEL